MSPTIEEMRAQIRELESAIVEKKKEIVSGMFPGRRVRAKDGTYGALRIVTDWNCHQGEIRFYPYKKNGEESKSPKLVGLYSGWEDSEESLKKMLRDLFVPIWEEKKDDG